MARPSAKKIIKDNLNRIEKWVASGLTMKDIAKNLGISERTLYKYKATDAQFMQTVKKGRQVAVEILENTMFKSATGFVQTVKKYEKVKRVNYKDGKKLKEWEEVVELEVEEYYKPDITAGIFLLKNWANYMNEPRALELREKEIEIQEKKLELSEYS
jgi:transcriptional regulator with XRE-family HTH domain